MKKILLATVLVLTVIICFTACTQNPSYNEISKDTGESSEGTDTENSFAHTDSENPPKENSEDINPDESSVPPAEISSDDDSSGASDPIVDSRSLEDIFADVSKNDNVASLNTISISIVKKYLDGQDTLLIRNYTSGSEKLFDLETADISSVDSAICIEPYEGPVEYCCYLIKLKTGADIAGMKEQLLSSADKARWGCIVAEKAMVIDSGNVILCLLASESEVCAYAKAFETVMGSAGTALYK